MRVFPRSLAAACGWPGSRRPPTSSSRCRTAACRCRPRTRRCARSSPSGRASDRRKIVNVERIPGGPVTLEFTNVPEARGARHAAALAQRLHGRAARGGRRERVALRSHHRHADVGVAAAGGVGIRSPPPPAPFGQMNGVMQPPQDDDDDQAPGAVQLPPALAPIFNNLNSSRSPPGPTRGARATQPAAARPRHLRHDAAAGTAARAGAGRAARAAGRQPVWRGVARRA